MKCYYHPERDAVAECVECSKGLCNECADKRNPPTCDGCGVSEYDVAVYKLKKIKKFAVIGLICGILGAVALIAGLNSASLSIDGGGAVVLYVMIGLWVPLVCTYALACIPVGWEKLNKLTSRLFLFLPIVGWIIYFFLKLMLAVTVGFFTLPFDIFKQRKIIKNNKP